jgi:hypothetical protein
MSVFFGAASAASDPVPLEEVAAISDYLTKNHPTLLSLLPQAGVSVADVLAQKTVVAPTEQAFKDLLKELDNKLPGTEDLKQLLLYHCSPRSATWKSENGGTLGEGAFPTANGKSWEIRGCCVYDELGKQSCVSKFVMRASAPEKDEPYVLVADRVLRMKPAAVGARGGGHEVHFYARS